VAPAATKATPSETPQCKSNSQSLASTISTECLRGDRALPAHCAFEMMRRETAQVRGSESATLAMAAAATTHPQRCNAPLNILQLRFGAWSPAAQGARRVMVAAVHVETPLAIWCVAAARSVAIADAPASALLCVRLLR
jgi:hypothetical protein